MSDQSAAVVSPTDEELRARASLKWSRAAPDEIPADIAELDFDLAPPVTAVLQDGVDRSDFGYPDFVSGTPVLLAEVFADRMERRFGWQPEVGCVELAAQIMQGLCCAILAFTDPGDIVITHAPTYRPILQAIEHLRRQCVTIPVEDLRETAQLEAALEGRRLEGRVRMIVLCQPHNPTGHVFDKRTLEVFGAFVDQRDAILFSDEIHQDFVHGSHEHSAPASVEALSARTITFTSAGKSFNIGGLRCAVGHFGSPQLHAAYSRLPWHLRNGASLPGVQATLAAWQSGDAWLAALQRQLYRNRAIVARSLKDLYSIRGVPPDATYFGWLDLRNSPAADDPRGFFLDKVRLVLQAGMFFGVEFKAFARLNFGTSEARLRTILGRLASALKEQKG
jgi:cystathionine beta-lyase